MTHLFGVRDDFQKAGLRAYSVALMTRIEYVVRFIQQMHHSEDLLAWLFIFLYF